MSHSPVEHLSADELDALMIGATPARAMSHLATCPECQTMRELDARLVAALSALPTYEPSTVFGDRVMAKVSLLPATTVVARPRTAREQSARRRVFVGAALTTGAVAAGFAWAIAHPGAALGFANPALADAGQGIWDTVQTIAANAVEQPWFGTVRETLATPSRAFPLLVGLAGAYALALTGLRRLLAEPATDAGW